jgi:hypothetical protein
MHIKHMEKALAATTQYLWDNMLVNEIRIDVFHFKDENGDIKCNPDVKNAVSKGGYRWK